MGGTAVFYGTRVPVQTLLDYLEAGETIDDFLEGFPSVTRAQVIAFLEAAKDRLVEISHLRVFLDECVDRRLARDLIGHDVRTARDMGWTTIVNGRLLALAAEQFDVFVTVDRNLSFQQNLVVFSIAVVVLAGRTNRLADLETADPETAGHCRSRPRQRRRHRLWTPLDAPCRRGSDQRVLTAIPPPAPPAVKATTSHGALIECLAGRRHFSVRHGGLTIEHPRARSTAIPLCSRRWAT